MTEDCGASVRMWVDVVRRARLDRTTKLVAFAIAHYADGDGRRIFPGIARLSYECGLGYNAIQSAMRRLREAELIEVVRHGTRYGRADEYRLILGENTFERIEVPTPAVAALEINRLQEGHRRRPKADPSPSVHPSASGVPDADPAMESEPVHPSGSGVRDDATETRTPIAEVCTDSSTPIRAVSVHPSRMGATNQYLDTTTTTNHEIADLRTAVTASRASPPENPDLKRLPEKCLHGIRARFRPDGTSSCALCRIGDAISPTGAIA